MKLRFLLILFNLFAYQSYAQTETSDSSNSFLIGGGRTFTGSGDYYGVMLYTQYNHSLNHQWLVSPRLSFAMGTASEPSGASMAGTGVFWQSSAMAIDIDFNKLIFPKITRHISVYLSAGPSLRYLIDTSPDSFFMEVNQSTGEVLFDEIEYEQKRGLAIGATGGINLSVNLANNFQVLGRASVQIYSDDSIVPFYGIAVGKRF